MLRTTMFALAVIFCSLVDAHPVNFPASATGVLEADEMTSGELVWMRGRVGEASYISVDKEGHHCTTKVPLAIGQLTRSGIGVEMSQGVKIIVTSQRLDAALRRGERIVSHEWIFEHLGQETLSKSDGLIVSGIHSQESFVLNSRRRWFTWLLGSQGGAICH